MILFSYAIIVIAAVWFLYKLYLSYSSAGGTDFLISVYDAAMYPPVIAVVGLYFVLPTYEINWSIWIYGGIWIGLTAVAALSLRIVEEIGDRPLR